MTRRRFSFSSYVLAAIVLAVLVTIVAARFTRLEVEVDGTALTAHRIAHIEFPVPTHLGTDEESTTIPVGWAESDQRPRNVVLIIGDGVGLGSLSTVSIILNGPRGGLAVETAPVTGLVRTWASNDLVTGSAASASAMATGIKTPKKSISTTDDGSKNRTIFEAAAARGLSTGIVTTSGLVDATPAAFVSHSPNRYEFRSILEQMLQSDADLLIGGDFTQHKKAKKQADYMDLVTHVESARSAGKTVVRRGEDLWSSSGPLVALLPPRPGFAYAHGPLLADTAGYALAVLNDNPSGFLLLLECEETDEGAHVNDLDRVVAGMAELDRATRRVLEFAGANGDTLVIVTADHDTGGIAILDGPFDEPTATVAWVSDNHIGSWVPLFAFGPGATRFSGVMDNTDIGLRIADLLGLEDFPLTTQGP